MTEAEVMKLLDVIADENTGASFELGDEVCYGSMEGSRKAHKRVAYIEAVIKAVPKRILSEYNRRLRKREADDLRAQADRIERGAE